MSYKSKTAIFLIIICLLSTSCSKNNNSSLESSQSYQHSKTNDNIFKTSKTSINSLSMVDENMEILKSRFVNLDDYKSLTLKLFNTNSNVYAEKVYLLLNGKQYDLNKADENLKTSFLKNDKKELSLKLNFDDIKDGKYYGVLIVEHQLRQPSKILENQGYEQFILTKGSSEKVKLNESNSPVLPIKKVDKPKIIKKIDKCIDFAIFTAKQNSDEKFVIKNNNFIEKNNEKDYTHYAYVYNNTKFETDYAILLITGDEVISSSYIDKSITLRSDEQSVYQINVPAKKIKQGTPYYFALVRYPTLDERTTEKPARDDYDKNLSFSQKFVLKK